MPGGAAPGAHGFVCIPWYVNCLYFDTINIMPL